MTLQTTAAEQVAQENAQARWLMAQGPHNAGKTALVRARVEGLLAQGTPADQVCVVAASDAAVQGLSDLAARGVRVTCARDLELSILSSERACEFTGRQPRLIMPFEDDFVKEDLKTTGVSAKQLKGMLGFFCKSLTTLEADDPYFFWEKDEQAVFNLARTCLAAYGPIHPCELAGMCLHYLQTLEVGEVRSLAGAAHFVVDDYQALNRASQLVLEELAPQTLWACADLLDEAQGADPFPYSKGVGEFCERHEGAVRVTLAAPAAGTTAAAAAQLAGSGFLDALSLGLLDSQGEHEVSDAYEVPCASEPVEGIGLLEVASWKDEFARVASLVKDRVEAGAAPAQVVVAAPNLTWARSLSKALKAAGLPVRRMATGQLVNANFRKLEACDDARLVSMLCLLADPDDGIAWRVWCGVGDYVARSNVFCELATHDCAEGGKTIVEALADLADAVAQDGVGPVHDACAQAFLTGRRLIDELAGLQGRALIDALAQKLGVRRLSEAVLDACLAAGPQAGACEMAASVRARATRRDFFGDPSGVGVCTYADVAGLSCAHLVLAGCMNGWLPEHAYFDAASASAKARQGMDRKARSLMYSLAGCAKATLTVSSFADVDLEVSEKLNLKGYRVSAGADGRRHMGVRRSVIADYALAAWGVIALDEDDLRAQVRTY